MAEDIKSTLAADVFGWVAEAAVGEFAKWAVGQFLEKMFGGGEDAEIGKKLHEIIANQQKIISELAGIKEQIDWDNLTNEIFDSVTLVQALFEQFADCAKISDLSQRQTKINSLVESATDPVSGLAPALTRIHDVASGVTPLRASQKGLIATFMDRALMQLNQNVASMATIGVYEDARGYLGEVFNLQYQGTVLLANCLQKQGQTQDAELAVQTLHRRLKSQLDKQVAVTPMIMKYVAYFKQHGGSVNARIVAVGSNLALAVQGGGPTSFHMPLVPPTGNQAETFRFEPVDATATRFYMYPVGNTAGDVLWETTCYGGSISWKGPDYWAGVANKGGGQWILLPSIANPEYTLVADADRNVWTFWPHFHHTFGNDGPNRIAMSPYSDQPNSQMNIEFQMAAPTVFP